MARHDGTQWRVQRFDDYVERAEPRDPWRRTQLEAHWSENAALLVRIVNSTTPAQRAALANKLRGDAADFEAHAFDGHADKGLPRHDTGAIQRLLSFPPRRWSEHRG